MASHKESHMTLKVTIQPAGHDIGQYPVFYAMEDGVHVGAAGELHLVADETNGGSPLEFRIYAPGTWKEINVEQVND